MGFQLIEHIIYILNARIGISIIRFGEVGGVGVGVPSIFFTSFREQDEAHINGTWTYVHPDDESPALPLRCWRQLNVYRIVLV